VLIPFLPSEKQDGDHDDRDRQDNVKAKCMAHPLIVAIRWAAADYLVAMQYADHEYSGQSGDAAVADQGSAKYQVEQVRGVVTEEVDRAIEDQSAHQIPLISLFIVSGIWRWVISMAAIVL
jgi:hypothetical protein